jgi:hypothetical protein
MEISVAGVKNAATGTDNYAQLPGQERCTGIAEPQVRFTFSVTAAGQA